MNPNARIHFLFDKETAESVAEMLDEYALQDHIKTAIKQTVGDVVQVSFSLAEFIEICCIVAVEVVD